MVITMLHACTCTVGPPVVSPFLYSNYDAQQYDEITALFRFLVGKDMPILMGDFNNGPASPGHNISWEQPFLYGLITARGLVSPYLTEDGRCTWCASNPSVAASGSTVNVVIDHIYVPTNTIKARVVSSKVT